MGFYLYDSRGLVGELASIHGLFELREVLDRQDTHLREFFDWGYTEEIPRLSAALSAAGSDDETIDETIVNLRGLLKGCREIAIISDAVETQEEEARKKAVKKKYALPRGKRHDAATRRKRALELYRPWGRRAQDFAHDKLERLAKDLGAEMTRGTHSFDLALGRNVIDIELRLPEALYGQEPPAPE